MATPATIAGITTSSPAVITGKTSTVRLSDEIKARETAKSPGGATLYDTGRVTVTATADRQVDVHRQGRNVTVWIKGTVPLAAGQTLGISSDIPADMRPPVGFDAIGALRLEVVSGTWAGTGSAWVDSTGVLTVWNSAASASNRWQSTISYVVD